MSCQWKSFWTCVRAEKPHRFHTIILCHYVPATSDPVPRSFDWSGGMAVWGDWVRYTETILRMGKTYLLLVAWHSLSMVPYLQTSLMWGRYLKACSITALHTLSLGHRHHKPTRLLFQSLSMFLGAPSRSRCFEFRRCLELGGPSLRAQGGRI